MEKRKSIKTIPDLSIKEPFSQENLNEIFRPFPNYPDRLISRESSWVEFKQSFNWGNREEYGKTLAAFTNNRGGYIVFGIGNNPRLLIGLKSDNFENFDPAKLTEYLNESFSPEISWNIHLHEIRGKLFGLIYAEESLDKPVIARKNVGTIIKEGEIYYWYRGRTEKIKFSELRQVIDAQRRKERDYWVKHINQIAKIGIKNTAIIDIVSGKVTGSGGSFLIDESLLQKIKFIKEGQFHETKGAPTLKLIGELQAIASTLIQPTKTIFRTKAITTLDIINVFLEQRKVSEPLEYIRQICFESSAFLPIYYFMKLANLNKDSTLNIIKNIQSRESSRYKLIERIETNREESLPMPTSSIEHTKELLKYRLQILGKKIENDFNVDQIRPYLRMIRTLKKDEIDQSYLFPVVKKWFNLYYFDRNMNLADDIRRTICHIDEVINKIR